MLSETEIAYLDIIVTTQEDVLWFEVSVEDFLLVEVEETQTDLNEEFQDQGLRKRPFILFFVA